MNSPRNCLSLKRPCWKNGGGLGVRVFEVVTDS